MEKIVNIKGVEFDCNPSGLIPSVIFKGNVYQREVIIGPKIEVFGTSENEIIKLATEASKLDSRLNTVMIYGPTDFWGLEREPVRLVNIC